MSPSPFIDTLMAEAEEVLGRYLGGMPATLGSGDGASASASQRLQLSQVPGAAAAAGPEQEHEEEAEGGQAPLKCGGIQTKTEFALRGTQTLLCFFAVNQLAIMSKPC
jgi:hypothetical protein